MTNLEILSKIEIFQMQIAKIQKQVDKALNKGLSIEKYNIVIIDLLNQISDLKLQLIVTIEVANLLSPSSSFYLKLS